MSLPGYSVAAVVSVLVVVALELGWLRTGVFTSLRYWLSMLIVLAFQVPVDGWLTKLSDPIVIYRESDTSGVRFPWDIPVEDFAFGFGMVTLVLLVWIRLGPDASAGSTTARTQRPARTTEESP